MTRPSERLKNTKLSSAPAKGLQKQSLTIQAVALENTGHLKRSVGRIAKKLKTKMAGQRVNKPSAKATSAIASATATKTVTTKTVTTKTVTKTATKAESDTATVIQKLPFVKDTKGSRLALNLLLVRPWFLLAGFWVVSLLSAAVAWEGMISPRILTMDLPQAESAPAIDKNSFLSVEQSPESGEPSSQPNAPTAETATGNAIAESAATNTADSTGDFPIWTLGALVGTCAAGCLAMSRRRAMVRMAATRSQGKRRIRPNAAPQVIQKKGSPLVTNSKVGSNKAGSPLKLVATRKPKRSPKRSQPKGAAIKGQPTRIKTAAVQTAGISAGGRGLLKSKKRRQRRRPVAAQATSRPNTGMPVLASRSDSQRSHPMPAAKGRPQRRKSSAVRGLKRNQSVVSVVPASESNALDWRNGSLAHQLDVRPQRTASM